MSERFRHFKRLTGMNLRLCMTFALALAVTLGAGCRPTELLVGVSDSGSEVDAGRCACPTGWVCCPSGVSTCVRDVRQCETTGEVDAGPVIGYSSVLYSSAFRGEVLVPNDPNDFQFAFVAVNSTNRATYTMNIEVSVAGSMSGDWPNAAVIQSGGSIPSASVVVEVPSNTMVPLVVSVLVPTNAVVGEAVTLRVSNSLPVTLTVGSTEGPARPWVFEVAGIAKPQDFTSPAPPLGADGRIGSGQTSPFSLATYYTNFYSLDRDPPDTFELVAKLSASTESELAALGAWLVEFQGAASDHDVTHGLVRELTQRLNSVPLGYANYSMSLTAPPAPAPSVRLTLGWRLTTKSGKVSELPEYNAVVAVDNGP